jgi:hypothetical protein
MSAKELSKREQRELIEIWLLANEGQASVEQLREMNRLLAEEPLARQLVLAVAHHQGWLVWQGAPTPTLATAREALSAAECRSCAGPIRPSWRERAVEWYGSLLRTRLFSARGLIAVACLIAAMAWLQSTSPQPSSMIAENNLIDVRIIGGTPCVWDSAGMQQLDWNRRLQEGDSLQLLEGIAELSLEHQSTVAKLVMEGPAAVLVARQAVPSLRYGKITVAIEAPSLGRFPVETPFGRVTLEPGTELGISMFGGSAQVHVFKGVASVESPWLMSSPQGAEPKIVSAGEALFFEGVGDVELQVTTGSAFSYRFPSQVSMQSDFLLVGPKYVNEIKRAAPIAYWRFEQTSVRSNAHSETLPNEMGDRFGGRIRGKVRWVGPEGNQAIEFGVTPEPGSMVVEESWDDLLDGNFTLEAWIKPSHYHLGSILGFIGEFDWADHRNKHGVLLEVCGTSQPSTIHQPERLRFLHRPTLGMGGGVQCFSKRSYQTRRWQHVAGVRDGDDLRLYLDGELVASDRDPDRMPAGLQLVLGQLYSETVERFFVGHVDEVAIYDRALTAEEIGRHYRLLRPDADGRGTQQDVTERLSELPMIRADRSLATNVTDFYSSGR